jgi:hydroxyacylglutathione hydrolase
VSISVDAVRWIHGAADCAASTDPLIQVHQFDQDTFIFRVSKCYNYEGNFLYLLFGRERAILLDTAGPPEDNSADVILPLRDTVDDVVARWRQARNVAQVDLVVAHTHSHLDHAFGDGQFAGRAHTTVVPPVLTAVTNFFGLSNWPEGESTMDLGERALTLLPLPGHDSAHIAVYDHAAQLLLTGDTLYPGLLTVRDWPAYRRSAARLAEFARPREVAWVLGAHIEMKRTPRELYPIGSRHQPDEHALPLTAAHIREWHVACEAMAPSPRRAVRDDFIIEVL